MDGTSARAALGVPKHASRDEIKKAYRQLAKQAHPDRGGDRAWFEVLTSAYGVARAAATQTPREHPFLVSVGEELPLVDAPLRHAYSPLSYRPHAQTPRVRGWQVSFAAELKRAMAS